jgi:acetyl-CoA carboxylase biotin carboxylase subunit
MFRKVLVANRGEIAVRVIRTLRELRIPSVAVYADADRAALHVRMADEAAHIGPSPSTESYLRIDRILEAARAHGAEAIHPGYGFLSENGDFAAACESAGIVFIGPSAQSLRLMGTKTESRRLAREAGVPVVPGTERPVDTVGEARQVAREFGYPVLLKASAGGGGKGMRHVSSDEDWETALRQAASEADRAFGNPELYVEKELAKPRHIEIQVLGDRAGNLIHLGERECSIQRRHQKLIEESPSPLVARHPEMRHAMGEAALRVAKATGYYNAGTVEFLVDADRNFYFLEMNTRLQVEHPVTELVTGLDLVQLQIHIATGEPLPLRQEDVAWRGSAMECRIYAEDPDNHFFPSPGQITQLNRPSGPGIRVDSGVYAGWTVPVDYDPLLAKLAVWAGTRSDAVARMVRALEEYAVAGIKTNIGFFRQIFEDEQFRQGLLHTGFIDEFFSHSKPKASEDDSDLEAVAAVVAAAHSVQRTIDGQPPKQRLSRWRSEGRQALLR